MVQTKEQFLFCYRAILDEYVRLWKEARNRKVEEEEAAKLAQPNQPKEQNPPNSGVSGTEDQNQIQEKQKEQIQPSSGVSHNPSTNPIETTEMKTPVVSKE